MRRPLIPHCTWLGSLLLSGGLAAQPDVEKPLSNVLLLVDTSGSMEFTAAGELPVCNPGQSGLSNESSRWIDLLQVLTGSVQNYSCFPQSRSTSAFVGEFSLGGTAPYDYGYANPYHRMLSGSCTAGPGVIPGSSTPWDFPTGGVNTFSYSSGTIIRPADLSTHTGCSGYSQLPNGILDIYKDRLRFGLMTFDTHLDAGTGVSGSSSSYASGIAGTFSYYLDAPKTGRPAGCASDLVQEVGARNPYAPPWEGRLVAFGPPNADVTDTDLRNAWIQDVLRATRPYGATPIAGMLDDARSFLFDDTSPDPFDSSEKFGPYQDPNWLADECRNTTIILLSDGEPNLDLRPFCEDADGICPYEEPQDIAAALRAHDPSVETIVIGFGLADVSVGSETIACEDLSEDDCSSDLSNKALQACCTLNEIAADGRPPDSNGDPYTAYFADDRDELREVFATILSQLSANISTRTAAVFTSASGTSQGGAFQFNSGFTPSAGSIWKGSLTRTRTVCVDGVPEEQAVDALEGDDFIANANSGTGTARRLFTAIPTGSASNTLRPYLGSPSDGLDASTATMTAGATAADFPSLVSAEVMQVDASACGTSTDAACRDLILGWTIGLTNARNETRCATEASCNLVGGIFHSTPKVVPGRPAAALRDESYQAFVAEQATAERSSVLYVSSVDGFLHAFKIAPFAADASEEVQAKENNLLWSFIPPAVLPVFQAQYPNTPATLLDGEPMIKEVVARLDGSDYVFERTVDDARDGAGLWRTVLVSGFGEGQVDGGYYALDVTNPNPATGGPRLLWQLTRDAAGNPLFGSGGTPLITTLYLQEGTDAAREVAVAVLPGGDAGNATSTLVDGGTARETTDVAFAARTQVRSYTGATEARSLTIVRLDTGAIIRTFRGAATSSAIDSSVTTLLDLPAPLVGAPAAYPGRVGDVADRIFIGDREGRLWVLNVASRNPTNWSMEVAFDAFWDRDSSLSQPIETAPVLSIDDEGSVVVIFSTGDQRVQSASGSTVNRIMSLTEVLGSSSSFETELNWVETLESSSTPGERVTGRMSLLNGILYFATGTPPGSAAGACATGSSRVWGVDYNRSADEVAGASTVSPASGPAPRLQDPDDTDNLIKSFSPESGIVFGVGVERQPTCTSNVEGFSGDPYAGLGSYTTQQNASAGGFFLVYQVGGTAGTSSAGRVETVKTALPVPKRPALIDSWALAGE